MRNSRITLLAIGIAIVLAAATDTSAHSIEDDQSLHPEGHVAGGSYLVDLFADKPTGFVASPTSMGNKAKPVVEYVRATGCDFRAYRQDWAPGCETQQANPQTCPDGSTAQEPLFSRTQQTDGTWTQWTMISYYTCPNNTDALLAAVLHEWSTLTPTPTTATLQPNTGWVYANVPTIAIADHTSQTHSTQLLGAHVDIRATPTTYTWTWGDGHHTTTTDPGTPYPNATITHTYSHKKGNVTVTLDTTWTGQYRINNTTWNNFTTTITTTTPPITLEVKNPHSTLVACTTNGHCR